MADRRNAATAAAVLGAKRHLKWTLSAPQLDKHRRFERGREEGGGASSSAFLLFFKCKKNQHGCRYSRRRQFKGNSLDSDSWKHLVVPELGGRAPASSVPPPAGHQDFLKQRDL